MKHIIRIGDKTTGVARNGDPVDYQKPGHGHTCAWEA